MGAKAVPGQNVGWRNVLGPGLLPGRDRMPWGIRDFLKTYGGTDESIIWVYACVTRISTEMASYPWSIMEKSGETIEREDVPEDLENLIENPNRVRKLTYFDYAQMVTMDLELAGNSYWLKDDRNALGQPSMLQRLRPEYVQIAADDYGNVIGYSYEVSGVAIPYDPDEIIHFRYPSPGDDYYGMGTVEAIQRELGLDLLQTEHVTGFFAEGARLSGLLTIDGAMSDDQFERMKAEFLSNYVGGRNQFRIMIAEQGVTFTPVVAPPASSGVVELRPMTKDAIITGFGVPEFLLGGTAQAGIYKMSEAQHILTRNMMPRATRYKERMTSDLVELWGDLLFQVDQEVVETIDDRTNRANTIWSAGGPMAYNEWRELVGLPPLDDPNADVPTVLEGRVPWTRTFEEPPPGLGPIDGGPLALPPGPEPDDDETATADEPAGIPDDDGLELIEEGLLSAKSAAEKFRVVKPPKFSGMRDHECARCGRPIRKPVFLGGASGGATPYGPYCASILMGIPVTRVERTAVAVEAESDKTEALRTDRTRRAEKILEKMEDDGVSAVAAARELEPEGLQMTYHQLGGAEKLGKFPDWIRAVAETGELEPDAQDTVRSERETGEKGVTLPFVGGSTKRAARVPRQPVGTEPLPDRLTLTEADPAIAEAILQARFDDWEESVAAVEKAMREFFVDQRKRILAAMRSFDDEGKAAKVNERRGHEVRYGKKALGIQRVWDDDDENARLTDAFLKVADGISAKMLAKLTPILDVALSWSLRNPRINRVRGILAEKVVRVNETTKAAIAETIEEGLRRGYSIPQIANGYEKEKFPGVVGVFDRASLARAEVIARTETANVQNAAAVWGYGEADVDRVEVIDGVDYDDACREANGSIWTLGRALREPTEHPQCTRTFVPIVDVPDEKRFDPNQPRDEEGQWTDDPLKTPQPRLLALAPAVNGWAETKPWNLSAAEVAKRPELGIDIVGEFEGYDQPIAGRLEGGRDAHGEGARISMNARTWERDDPASRARLLYHEAGHAVFQWGSFGHNEEFNEVIRPWTDDSGNPFSPFDSYSRETRWDSYERNPAEAGAEAYAAIMMGEEKSFVTMDPLIYGPQETWTDEEKQRVEDYKRLFAFWRRSAEELGYPTEATWKIEAGKRSEKRFDPNQPRDDDGRWTDGLGLDGDERELLEAIRGLGDGEQDWSDIARAFGAVWTTDGRVERDSERENLLQKKLKSLTKAGVLERVGRSGYRLRGEDEQRGLDPEKGVVRRLSKPEKLYHYSHSPIEGDVRVASDADRLVPSSFSLGRRGQWWMFGTEETPFTIAKGTTTLQVDRAAFARWTEGDEAPKTTGARIYEWARENEIDVIVLDLGEIQPVEFAVLNPEALKRGHGKAFDPSQPRDDEGRWTDTGLRAPRGGPVLSLKADRDLTDKQADRAISKMADSFADFYGVRKPEIRHEPEATATWGTEARALIPPGKAEQEVWYGERFRNLIKDAEMGIYGFRPIAHELAHASLSGTPEGPLPGFSQTFEEGSAEILSLWFWRERGQPFDERDAVRRDRKWEADPERALAGSVVYRAWTAETMRRAASRVGWDPDEIVAEVRSVMAGDHGARLQWRDATDPEFELPPGVEPERWFELDQESELSEEDKDVEALAEALALWLVTSDRKDWRSQPRDPGGEGGGRWVRGGGASAVAEPLDLDLDASDALGDTNVNSVWKVGDRVVKTRSGLVGSRMRNNIEAGRDLEREKAAADVADLFRELDPRFAVLVPEYEIRSVRESWSEPDPGYVVDDGSTDDEGWGDLAPDPNLVVVRSRDEIPRTRRERESEAGVSRFVNDSAVVPAERDLRLSMYVALDDDERPPRAIPRRQLRNAALFDAVIGNQDRHHGNMIFRQQGGFDGPYDLWLIDNGLSFPEVNDRDYVNEDIVGQVERTFGSLALTDDEVEFLRGFDESDLRDRFEGLLSPEEISAMANRINVMIESGMLYRFAKPSPSPRSDSDSDLIEGWLADLELLDEEQREV
jgi:HK97 family phage portal protein